MPHQPQKGDCKHENIPRKNKKAENGHPAETAACRHRGDHPIGGRTRRFAKMAGRNRCQHPPAAAPKDGYWELLWAAGDMVPAGNRRLRLFGIPPAGRHQYLLLFYQHGGGVLSLLPLRFGLPAPLLYDDMGSDVLRFVLPGDGLLVCQRGGRSGGAAIRRYFRRSAGAGGQLEA